MIDMKRRQRFRFDAMEHENLRVRTNDSHVLNPPACHAIGGVLVELVRPLNAEVIAIGMRLRLP